MLNELGPFYLFSAIVKDLDSPGLSDLLYDPYSTPVISITQIGNWIHLSASHLGRLIAKPNKNQLCSTIYVRHQSQLTIPLLVVSLINTDRVNPNQTGSFDLRRFIIAFKRLGRIGNISPLRSIYSLAESFPQQ